MCIGMEVECRICIYSVRVRNTLCGPNCRYNENEIPAVLSSVKYKMNVQSGNIHVIHRYSKISFNVDLNSKIHDALT